MQTLVIAVQQLHFDKLTLRKFFSAAGAELATSCLLGVACAAVVGAVAWLWKGDAATSSIISLTIVCSMAASCVYGVLIPAVIHSLRGDLRVAAGPITLAVTDVSTVLLYMNIAEILIHPAGVWSFV